jgi:hypothetical protein
VSRLDLISHPALLLAVTWIALLAIDIVRRRLGWTNKELAHTLFVTFSLGLVAAFAGIAIWYATRLSYFDAAEPTITAVASVFKAGRPLYPALDAPERYAHVYGPALFVIHASALAAFGSSILVSKAVGAIAILASLAVGFLIFRERAGLYAATLGTAVCALVYMGFSNVTFWTRSDPLLILCATVSLLATRVRRPLLSMVLLGLTTGIAVNLKVTGVLYIMPAVAVALNTHGVRRLAVAGSTAAGVAAAPFLLTNVSLAHYADYLGLSARNGIAANRIKLNVEAVVFLTAPLIAVLLSARRIVTPSGQTRSLLMALVPAVIVIAILGSKPGGGPFHLVPFVPVLVFTALGLPRVSWTPVVQTLALAFAVTAFSLALPRQLLLIATTIGRDLGPAVGYIRAFADSHPGKRIGVGYAGTSALSYARPEAVFRTGDYFLDAPAIQEHELAGLTLPEATFHALAGCRIEYMLVPNGERAFAVPSAYYPDGPKEVFPAAFRAEFLRRYRWITTSDVFDVWECVG